MASSNKSETLVVCEIMFCLITLSPSLSFNFLAVLNIASSFRNSSDCLFSSFILSGRGSSFNCFNRSSHFS